LSVFELGQQKINFNFFDLHLPDDDLGKGKKKPEIQQLYEEIGSCGKRLIYFLKSILTN